MPLNRNTERLQRLLDAESQRVSAVTLWINGLAIILLVSIGLKAAWSGHQSYGQILMMLAIPLALNFLDYRLSRNALRTRTIMLSTVGLLFAILVSTGGESNTGPLWLYAFPPLVFYLTSPVIGLVLTGLCMAMSALMFRFPELPFVSATYTPDFQLRFLLTLGFETLFCYVLDYSRRQARNQLLEVAGMYEYAARTDELTKLANRRDMREQLDKELARYQRNERPFSVILIDLDHFKRINDRYGHEAGDHILIEFAALMSNLCRKSDVASRWGGEEFLILLPDTALLQALILAERLRAGTEGAQFLYKGETIPVSISAGVCSISQQHTLESLLNQADHNLYEAKAEGRNRIVPRVKSTGTTEPERSGAAELLEASNSSDQ